MIDATTTFLDAVRLLQAQTTIAMPSSAAARNLVTVARNNGVKCHITASTFDGPATVALVNA